METATRIFTVSFKDQVNDGLVKSDDMISFLKSKMKVKNSKEYASRVLTFTDNETSIEVSSSKGNVLKADMKQYIRRFLRTKALRNFIRVVGDSEDGISLQYINTVEDGEE